MVVCAIALAACRDESQLDKERAAQDAAELALMRDLSRAVPEIERRLRARIHSNGSIILVKEEFGSLHAMPSTVGWTTTCGGGLSLSIAAAGQDNGLHLPISDALLEEEDCNKLLPLTAAKIIDIIAGR
jgi:hypothetical protein